MSKPKCYATAKVRGDLSAELPTPHPDCVNCPVNTDCYYQFGQLDRRAQIATNIQQHGQWRSPR